MERRREFAALTLLLLLGACELNDESGTTDASRSPAPRDAGAQPFDSGGGSSDSGASASDSGGRLPDAGWPPSDAGGDRSDAGARQPDAGAPSVDAGAPSVDAGAESADAGADWVAPTTFDNPIIKYDAPDPTNGPGNTLFTADGAALVWKDKVYLYADHDEAPIGGSSYVMKDWLLYESTDLVHWENKGVIASYKTFSWANGDAMALQVIERDDKNGNPKFYLYGPLNAGQVIGVAVADKPEGPFKDARGIPLIYLNDTANTPATHGWRNLDPTVFIDDNGQAYLGWGNGIYYWAKLEDDMIHLKGETYTTDANGKMKDRSIGGVQIHYITNATLTGYVEAPWLSKHGNLYYLTYAAHGTSGEGIAHATSSSPEGPWQYRGLVIDSVPNSFTVHQSPFDYRGGSFMAYHNGVLPSGGSYRRSQCLDRLYYNADGTMKKIVQTSK